MGFFLKVFRVLILYGQVRPGEIKNFFCLVQIQPYQKLWGPVDLTLQPIGSPDSGHTIGLSVPKVGFSDSGAKVSRGHKEPG